MDWRIRLALAVIRRDLAEPLNIAALAARVNLSRSRLTHLFRAEIGVAPGAYLRSARLARAAELLAHSTLSIKEIMATVGVNDPSHFARDFRRAHGVSPRWFRAHARDARPAARHGRAGRSAHK
jgi:transcriptional regulator GlxA family with amidase domain